MKTIILDYWDSKVKILNHGDGLQIEDIESILFEEYSFNQNVIEWMTVDELVIEYLNEDTTSKATFSIDQTEIEEFAKRKLSKLEIDKILSYIENDESIWNAIENSKREALLNIL